MNILITGANGYIGQRLIQFFLDKEHILYCCVRNRERFESENTHPSIHTVEVDFLYPGNTLLPKEIDVAFYLIHSLTSAVPVFPATGTEKSCKTPQFPSATHALKPC